MVVKTVPLGIYDHRRHARKPGVSCCTEVLAMASKIGLLGDTRQAVVQLKSAPAAPWSQTPQPPPALTVSPARPVP